VGASKGVGVLVVKQGIEIAPLLTGGGQEMRFRAGTENMMAIASLAKIIDIFSDTDFFNQEQKRILTLRNQLEQEIKQLNPDVIIVGSDNPHRVNNTICMITAHVESEKQVIIADLNKVCVSAGSACSSGKVKKSHVLSSYGYGDAEAGCSLRLSLGYNSTEQDIIAFTKAYKMIMSAGKN
jgi:cysteine desulfurase